MSDSPSASAAPGGRDALRGLLADLVRDVRQWTEQVDALGGTFVPPAPRAAFEPARGATARSGRSGPQRATAPPAPPRGPSAYDVPPPGPIPGTPTAHGTPATQLPGPPLPRPAPVARTADAANVGKESLDAVRRDLGECTRCGLHRTRRSLVFGVGDPAARLVLVGEAPGAHEDRLGEPFVGRAGQLLTRMLGAIGLRRDDVYICNVLKCRPPNNRDPQAGEIATCGPYLHRQLGAISPDVVMTLGRFASQHVVGLDLPMGRLRGEVRDCDGTSVVPTYHPAYLLRNPRMKGAAWQDLLRVRELLRRA